MVFLVYERGSVCLRLAECSLMGICLATVSLLMFFFIVPFFWLYREIPTPPALPENGTCVRYNGSICSKLLKGEPVYIKSYEKLENIERKLSNAYDNIRNYKEISQRCRPFVQPLLCHYQFPSCDATSPVPKPRQICYEECEVLRTKICAKEYMIAQSQLLQHVLFPVCSALPRRGTKEGKNCITLEANEPRIPKPQKPIVRKGWCP